jgi:hypothetical protein
VLLLLLYSVAHRHTTAALRIETVRAQQQQRDEGTIHAIARGLALLETGIPPSSPYVCGVTINTSTGPSSFTVTFTSEGGDNWSVRSAPTLLGDNPEPMPAIFVPLP